MTMAMSGSVMMLAATSDVTKVGKLHADRSQADWSTAGFSGSLKGEDKGKEGTQVSAFGSHLRG